MGPKHHFWGRGLSLFLGEKMPDFGRLGKGVSNLIQTFNKFFKIEKQKALGNAYKAVKDLNSRPSFNFVLNSMGNFKRLGNNEDQTGEKKGLVWLGKQPILASTKKVFFGPAWSRLGRLRV
jgi:hypothetical protein